MNTDEVKWKSKIKKKKSPVKQQFAGSKWVMQPGMVLSFIATALTEYLTWSNLSEKGLIQADSSPGKEGEQLLLAFTVKKLREMSTHHQPMPQRHPNLGLPVNPTRKLPLDMPRGFSPRVSLDCARLTLGVPVSSPKTLMSIKWEIREDWTTLSLQETSDSLTH